MAEKLSETDKDLKYILTCQLCLHTIQNPQKLQCLHSFCKECIGEVPKQENDGVVGWLCPLCYQFSAEKEVQPNSFIAEMLSFQTSDVNKGPVICKQCPKNVSASWKCLDCKIELCTECQVSHLMIPILKNHGLVQLSEASAEQVIDNVVLCKIHDNEPIKFNCQQCEIPICINCKVVDHDGHKTETVKNALVRLLPMLHDGNDKVKANLTDLEQNITALRKKKEEIMETYDKCRAAVRTRVEGIKSQINALGEEMILELEEKEKKSTKRLDKQKKNLENKLAECENLTKVVAVTTEKAREVSLLSQIQEGLFRKVHEKCNNESLEATFKIAIPSYEELDVAHNLAKAKKLLGKVQFHNDKVKDSLTSKSLGRCMDDVFVMCNSFENIFSRTLKKELSIQVPTDVYRLKVVTDHFWTTSYHSKISIYNQQGKLIDTIRLTFQSPRAACKTPNGAIIVASNNGLHVKESDSTNWLQIVIGKFSDICIQGDTAHALEYSTATVIRIRKHNGQWQQKNVYQVPGLSCNFMNTLITGDNYYYIGDNDNGRVIKLTKENGKVQSKVYSKPGLKKPMLCGCDSQGNVLVADSSSNQFHVLKVTEVIQWKTVDFKIDSPRDIFIDGDKNVWVLHGCSSLYEPMKLTKFVLRKASVEV